MQAQEIEELRQQLAAATSELSAHKEANEKQYAFLPVKQNSVTSVLYSLFVVCMQCMYLILTSLRITQEKARNDDLYQQLQNALAENKVSINLALKLMIDCAIFLILWYYAPHERH